MLSDYYFVKQSSSFDSQSYKSLLGFNSLKKTYEYGTIGLWQMTQPPRFYLLKRACCSQ